MAMVFADQVFHLFPNDGGAAAAVRDAIESHGGRVEEEKEKAGTGATVVLTQEIGGLSRQQRTALSELQPTTMIRAQWVTDCVQQSKRLEQQDYVVTVGASEEPDAKRRRIQEDSSLHGDRCVKKSAEEVQPHLRPWKAVQNGALYYLDARAEGDVHPMSPAKMAMFDLDGTLIVTKSGKKFAKDCNDWVLAHPSQEKQKLQALAQEGFTVVIISNQNGVSKGKVTAAQLQKKIEAIVKKLGVGLVAMFSTQDDLMRKPRFGQWEWLLGELQLEESRIDRKASFYCGDAAGRPKVAGRNKDFAATDYEFALNIDLPFFTPEKLFLESSQRIHSNPDMWEIDFDPRKLAVTHPLLDPPSAECARSTKEIVVLTGPPASGKSHFAAKYFGASYAIVNQDELKTIAKCRAACEDALIGGKSVVIDCTNRDARARSEWISVAKEQKCSIRCFFMDVSKPHAMHLNIFRKLTTARAVPDIAIHAFFKNFAAPSSLMSSKVKDGFFLGDVEAAQDAEFLQLNGIVHVVNCAPRQVPNVFQSPEVSYTTCDLDEVLRRPFFDTKNAEFMGIVQLIDRALINTEGVLVHSFRGVNRSPSFAIAYLMVKYCWGVEKAYEFVMTKRPDAKPHESYFAQLCALEAQLQKEQPRRATEEQMCEWNSATADPHGDELILVHTFLNSSCKPISPRDFDGGRRSDSASKDSNPRVSWIDHNVPLHNAFPSLLVKPERPPNPSYNDMKPANGWTDLVVAATSTTMRRPVGMPTNPTRMVSESDVTAISRGEHEDAIDPSSSDAFLARNQRMHSFSLPKRKENESWAMPPSTNATPSELGTTQDAADLADLPPKRSSSALPSKTIARSDLQCSRPAVRSKSRQASTAPGRLRARSTPASATTTPRLMTGLALAKSDATATHAPPLLRKSQSRPTADRDRARLIDKPTAGSTGRLGSLLGTLGVATTNAKTGRVLVGADVPDAERTTAAGTELPGPGPGHGMPTSTRPTIQPSGRPRTAPPRLGKKSAQGPDLMALSGRTPALLQSAMPAKIARVSLDVPPSTVALSSSGRNSSAMPAAATTAPITELPPRLDGSFRASRGTGPVGLTQTRPKTTRAHWR